jgi:hypothetical protein
LPVVQSAFVAQVVRHDVAPHTYAPHWLVVAAPHVPAPLQVCADV